MIVSLLPFTWSILNIGIVLNFEPTTLSSSVSLSFLTIGMRWHKGKGIEILIDQRGWIQHGEGDHGMGPVAEFPFQKRG